MRSQRLKTWQVVLCLAAVASAACGSRLSREEILAQNVVTVEDGDGGSTAGVGDDGQGLDLGPGHTTGSASAEGPSTRSSGRGGDNGSTEGPVANGPGTGGGRAADVGDPIVIGFIGYLSGLGGSALNPGRDAWVAWERSTNADGGINGHPVKVLVGDDGGEPSRSVALARDFVENKGAIALTYVGSGMPFASYAKQHSVPVIGSIPTTEDWQKNPMLFPAFGGAHAYSWGGTKLIANRGMKKMAVVYCAESADCEQGANRVVPYAEENGLEVVAKVRYSVVAADYTAECLSLRDAGAEAIMPTGDNNSIIRLAKSCGRQGYRPVWVTPSADDAMAAVPEFDGGIVTTPAFPWFMRSGSPGVDEYVKALTQYAPKRLTEGVAYQSWAWQSAKLFEAAAQHVSKKPTSQDILEGLWAMKGFENSGLSQGAAARTYTRGKATPETYCVYDTRIVGGKWTAPRGLTPICR